MPNPTPTEGRCNAKRKDGQFCANKPHIPNHLGGNGRCKFHGGLAGGVKTKAAAERIRLNNLKHGFYAKRLETAFRDEKDRETFRKAPREADLATEIALVRTKIAKYHELLESGVQVIQTRDGTGVNDNGEVVLERNVDVELLLARAIAILNRLVESQFKMHPESARGGSMTIRFVVEGGTMVDEDMPNLEADGEKTDEPIPAPAEGPDAEEPALDKFEELD